MWKGWCTSPPCRKTIIVLMPRVSGWWASVPGRCLGWAMSSACAWYVSVSMSARLILKWRLTTARAVVRPRCLSPATRRALCQKATPTRLRNAHGRHTQTSPHVRIVEHQPHRARGVPNIASQRTLRKFATQRKLKRFDRRKSLQRRQAALCWQRQRQALRKRWRNLKTNLRRINALLFWHDRYCRTAAGEETCEQD